jgi:glycine hydroxymethyltransferase
LKFYRITYSPPPSRCSHKAYAKQVKANAVAIGNYLMSKGYKMVTDGTENHLVLWDLRPLGLTGMQINI